MQHPMSKSLYWQSANVLQCTQEDGATTLTEFLHRLLQGGMLPLPAPYDVHPPKSYVLMVVAAGKPDPQILINASALNHW